MKNLKIDRIDCIKLDDFEGYDEFAINPITGEICVSTKSDLVILEEGKITRKIKWDSERRDERIISLSFRTDENQLVAILADGRALIVNEQDEIIEFELCQISEKSYADAEWSGDEQMLAICDGSQLYLCDSFLCLFEQKNLDFSENERSAAPVNVGWGSEMTQFRGSEGKMKSQQLEVDRKEIEQHNYESEIHWRWDGEYLAVSYYSKQRENRFLTVFDKNGNVMSAMNNRNIYLSKCFAHKPNANLICSASLNSNSGDGLVFYERNGETRNGYGIKWKKEENDLPKRIIKNISWNLTGSILAIETKVDNMINLEFWSLSNYEFTRKYNWKLPLDIKWKWSVAEESKMFVMMSDSRLVTLNISSFVSYSNNLHLNLVVASDELRVSDLCRRVIPPPMSESVIEVKNGIVAYTTSPENIHILDENSEIYKYSRIGNITEFEKIGKSCDLSGKFSLVAGLLFDDKNDSYIIWGLGTKNSENCVYRIGGDGSEQCLFEGSDVAWIGLNPVTEVVEIALADGRFIDSCTGRDIFNIPSFTSISVIFFGPSGERLFLTDDSSFYTDATRVTNNVTSFMPRGNEILLIDFNNKLRFVDIEKRSTIEEDSRDVEAGCEIVAVSPDSVNVVLQAPRGNLEAIHPRRFVVNETRRMLDAKEYIKALLWMKKHRINMSYSMEYQKKQLAENSRIWLESNDSQLLEQLVVSCTERDDLGDLPHELCKTIYEYIRNFVDVERKGRLFPLMLTALLRMNPARVDQALKEVQLHAEISAEKKDVFTRQCLHHISFFVAAKQLFNCALSTYDLKLAQQVAEASNYDPKEYLPVLNRLNKIDDRLEREYRIDVTREAWRDVIGKLLKLDERDEGKMEWWNEVREIVGREGLYQDVLCIQKPGDKRYRDCCEMYGLELERKAHWKQAALLFEMSENCEKAIKCYEMAKDVDGLLSTAKRFDYDAAKLKIHVIKMMTPLKEARMLKEVVKAMRIVGSRGVLIVETLCDAQEWENARRDAITVEEREILGKMAMARKEQILGEILKRSQEFEKYRNRLVIVRENKLKRVHQFASGEVEDLRDDVSQVSSISSRSGSSRVSMASSVRKRKQIEKKKSSLKEGGEYEDSALLNALAENYRWFEVLRGELEQLVPVLISVGEVCDGLELRRLAGEMVEKMRKARSSIWPENLAIQHLPGPLYALFDSTLEPSPIAMPNVFRLEPELIAPAINFSEIFP